MALFYSHHVIYSTGCRWLHHSTTRTMGLSVQLDFSMERVVDRAGCVTLKKFDRNRDYRYCYSRYTSTIYVVLKQFARIF